MLLTALTIVIAPVRLVAVLICVILGLTAQITLFSWINASTARRTVALWSRTMLACLGVRLHLGAGWLTTTTTSPHWVGLGKSQSSSIVETQPTALYVCNHISWLDILTLLAVAPVVFVAKSEIKHWPVLGTMVALAGTCFIERDRRTALRGVHMTLVRHLQAGQSICIFPEGTTSDGLQVLPFHAGLLQAAIDAGVPVQTMRLDYSHPAAAFIGEMTLLQSLIGVLCAPQLSVQVQTLNALPTQNEGVNRQTLASEAHLAITNAAKSTTN